MNSEKLSKPKVIKAAVLTELGKPVEIIENIKLPELQYGQVLVRVDYAGVCHSQLMEVRGKRGDDPWLPHMLGHEGTGQVVDIGDGVKKVQAGDEVVLGWIKGEGINAAGAKYETEDGVCINSGSVTTFSNYTIVSENRLVKLPEGTPKDLGVLYGCALPTGAGIIFNEVKPTKKNTIVVFGMGGIGISALIAASLYKPELLIAVDIEEKKIELAKELGATHTVNANTKNVIEEVLSITNGAGVDYAIEAAGHSSTIELAFEMVKRGGGRCIFASHPQSGEKICIDPFELIAGKSIEGSWGGSSIPDRDIPILGNYYKDGKLKLNKLLSHTYRLDDINNALDDLENRKIVRALIKIEH